MRINNKSLACDSCGMVMNDDFTYYSLDARLINVYNNNRQSIDNCFLEEIAKSNEFCPICYEQLAKKVVVINAKEIKPSRMVRNYDLCEVTGNHLKGDYKYYYIVIDKVNVKSTSNYICVKCKQQYSGKPDHPCKCGNNSFINPSNVNVSNRMLEIKASIASYDALIKPVNVKPGGNWSTST